MTRPQLEKLWAYGRSLPKVQRMQRYMVYKGLYYQVALLVRVEHELFRFSGVESGGLTDKERKYILQQYEDLKQLREKVVKVMVRLQHSSAWGQKP